MPEVIPIASNHAGFALKQRLIAELRHAGLEPLDVGTDPAFEGGRHAARVAKADGVLT